MLSRAAAVDAGQYPFDDAIAAGVDFLICHHGLYWNAPIPLVGRNYKKIKTAVDGNLAPQELKDRRARCQRVLYDCYLLRNRGQLVLLEAVKFVKAAPRAALDEAQEDAAHTLEVNAFVAYHQRPYCACIFSYLSRLGITLPPIDTVCRS